MSVKMVRLGYIKLTKPNLTPKRCNTHILQCFLLFGFCRFGSALQIVHECLSGELLYEPPYGHARQSNCLHLRINKQTRIQTRLWTLESIRILFSHYKIILIWMTKSIIFNKQMMRHFETFLQYLFMVGIQILTSNHSYLYLNYFWGFKPKV